ncbi:MAG: 16S rRNA (cytosine(1402)-N(4))-methyltransferase RsmH, partial [Bacteroidales bacterium]|nr:16S rRNA (cytosine(1402)-N(4))-methyltransferase RsmH [Bacteroidales bacterium]
MTVLGIGYVLGVAIGAGVGAVATGGQGDMSGIGDSVAEGMKGKFDGILMDLGVSSPQFDDGIRGFSYRVDANLDMRMDQRRELTARDVVNTYSEKDLIRIFQEYGEERFAHSISRNIIKARDISPIETTFQLVEIIKNSKPAKELKKAGHPAKQVFQALRIEVNDEL